MTKSAFTDWDTTAANNLDLNDIPLGEGLTRLPSLNNLIRNMMAQLRSGVPAMAAGVFTPAFTLGGSATGITFSNQSGRYVKLGSLVFLEGRLTFTNKGANSSNPTITGLPFAAAGTTADATGLLTVGYVANMGVTVDGPLFGRVAGTSCRISYISDGNAINGSGDVTNTTEIFFSGSYIAA